MLRLIPLLAFASPIRLEFMSWPAALGLFAGLAAFVVFLGMRSLNGLGPVRKWVAIGIRLLVVLTFVLILAGVRVQRKHETMEVWVLRDVSGSTDLVDKRDYPGKSLQDSIDDYLKAASKDSRKKRRDTLGIISFQESAQIDSMPSTEVRLDTRGIREHGGGTDLSAAIQLALASMSPDAMHRIVLFHDGNSTTGSLDSAIAAAASQHVPIDVMPLRYDVKNAVMVERFIAPTWKRENEPFTIDVILRSSGTRAVSGKLDVIHKTTGPDQLLEHDRPVTLIPGLNVVHVPVPALPDPGVHRFVAKFTPDPGSLASAGETVSSSIEKINQPAEAITFVRGQGQVLYVDNYRDAAGNRGPGQRLEDALRNPKAADARAVNRINVNTIDVEHFPQNLLEMQNYDAIILGNVPHGQGGLSAEQDRMLSQYAHDTGGGVIMLGGDESFGAGGWQGSELEKVLPVDMDIPAQRQVGKGALVLVMHSCEMPDGNYWGLQCALEAIKTLSNKDEIGIISYGWGGGPGGNGIGGATWDFPLQEKNDGSAVIAAAKKMQLGDMPSFDDSMNLALNGVNGGAGLAKSNARHKHVIIISDGDPAAPQAPLVQAYKQAKVSVSTVTVYPHMGGVNSGLPPVMEQIPADLGGKPYGPINSRPNQLPQIFIKEATIVRRSLIHEDEEGMPVKLIDASDPAATAYRGLEPPPIFGMVLTSRKNDPKVTVAMTTGKLSDPVLADWQAGLGKTLVFTSDPTARWGASWVASPQYDAFWGNVVRSVERPPMSEDFDARTTASGGKGKIVIEAVNKDDNFQNFLNISGDVLGPGGKPAPVHLVQTGPGTYEGSFDATDAGSYAVALSYRGQKQKGYLRGGVAVNTDPEFRELQSNDAILQEIKDKTGGRILPAWDADGADLFSRDNVPVGASPLPVWDVLLPVLLALILLDVAARRIAWDWAAIQRAALAVQSRVLAFTAVRKVQTRDTLDALRRVREETAESKFKQQAEGTGSGASVPAPQTSSASARPDPRAKFQAKAGVEGDISQVVGGATDKPMPAAPKKIDPKGNRAEAASHTGSLLEAKRRAQQQIKKKEEGDGAGK